MRGVSRRTLLGGVAATALATAADPAGALRRDQISHLLNYAKPLTYDPSFVRQVPLGAIGLWPFDSLKTSPRVYVPNLVDSSAPTLTLIGPGRRNFNNGSFWVIGGSPTITDSATTAPDGSGDASTIVQASGNWYLTPTNAGQSGTNLPNGTYTAAVNVKWLGTGSQNFRLGNYVGTQVGTFTATSSWQRFSYTFSITGPTNGWVLIWTPDGSSAVNLAICDFEVYAGSADLGPAPATSHVYFNPNAYNNTPPSVGAGGLVDLSTGANTPYFQTKANTTLSAFSVVWATSDVSAGGNSQYQPLLALMVGTGTGWQNFAVGNSLNNALCAFLGGVGSGTPLGSLHAPADMDGQGRGVATFAVTYDGSSLLSMYANGILLGSVAAASASATVRDFYVGLMNQQYYTGYKMGHLALYPRALSNAEVISISALFSARMKLRGTATSPARIVLFEGDSITYGAAASIPNNCWAALAAQNCSPAIHAINTGVSGSTLATLTGRESSDDALAASASAPNGGRKPILHLMIGTNDLGIGNPYSGNASGYATAVQSYLNARRATGYYAAIVLSTLISRTSQSDGGTQFDIDRATYNTAIRGWVGTTINACSDFASNSTMGANGAASNGTYFNSGLHPTDAGYALMAPIAEAAINPLWTY